MSLQAIKAAKKANANAPGRSVADANAIDSRVSVLKFDSILSRYGEDTRAIDDDHVEELALSIAAVGLIQPIAVDCKGRLLAGGHRRAALEMLWEYNDSEDEELGGAWERLFPGEMIPVRVFEFDSADAPDAALLIEAAENEKRRDYKPQEVLELYRRLEAQGYVKTGGRPKKGEKSLTRALEQITGKNRKQVNRLLAKAEQPEEGTQAEQLTDATEELDKVVLRAMRSLAKVLESEGYDLDKRKYLVAAIRKLGKVCTTEQAQAIAKAAKI